ncbi:MAG: helix-turn-helix transcriptional regulator [Chloroflexota bacterium]
MKSRGRPPHPGPLTNRQHEVLDLVREGHTNRTISTRLGITVRTVKSHLSEIFSRLGATNRHEASEKPIERGKSIWWLPLTFGLLATIAAAAASVGLLTYGAVATGTGDCPGGSLAQTRPDLASTAYEIEHNPPLVVQRVRQIVETNCEARDIIDEHKLVFDYTKHWIGINSTHLTLEAIYYQPESRSPIAGFMVDVNEGRILPDKSDLQGYE